MTDSVFGMMAKVVMVLLLTLLVVTFAVGGIGSDLRNINSNSVVAKVGSMDITIAEHQALSRYELNKARGGLGFDIDENMQEILTQKALETLVNQKLFLQEAKRLGLLVGKEHVKDEIANNRIFQVDGKFDKDRFELMLTQLGETSANYPESLRRQLAVGMLIEAILTEPVVPTVLANLVHQYDAEKRTVEAMMIPVSYIKNVAEPTDDELKTYFEAVKEDFSAPEYRSMSYLALTSVDVENEIDTSDDALTTYYEANTDLYSKGEVRTLKQIFTNEAETSLEIHKALEEGKSFVTVAKELADQDESALDYGDTERGDLAGIIDEDGIDALFSLKKGEFAKPVKSLLGWHVFKVVDIQAPSTTPLADVKDKVKKEVLASQAGDLLYQLSGEVEDELAGGATLEEVAKKLNLTLTKVNDISANGVQVVAEIGLRLPKYGEFLKTAFSMDEGAVSQLASSEDGFGYYIMRVDGVTHSRLRVLEEARGKVLAAWQKQKQQELQVAKANEVAESLKLLDAGARLESLRAQAKNMGIKLKLVKAVYRGSFNEAFLPRPLVKEIFTRQGAGVVSNAYARNDGTMVIGVVSEIVPLNENDPQFGLQPTRTAMRKDMSGDVMNQLMTHLRRRYTVKYRK